MKVNLAEFNRECSCNREHKIVVKDVFIERGAVKYLEGLINDYHHPVIICDENTYAAAEPYMKNYFQKIEVLKLQGNDIHANDHYVDVVAGLLNDDADILIAVGAGTVHDLTRYTAYSRGLQFISVPTAASVDGFVSSVAAMTWKGMKKTLTAVAPLYVLADTDIFGKAPYRLTASGISDLLGKYTALLDWRVCHILTGEYLCEEIFELEEKAVKEVEDNLELIKAGSAESLEKLMYALILSGLAMQMTGNSRPASGAEHHVSHLIEMAIINDENPALHGEKVSVGLLLCLEHYEKIRVAIEENRCKIIDGRNYEEELLKETFGKKGKYQEVLEENEPNIMADLELHNLEDKLLLIAEELKKLPNYSELKTKLEKAGCITELSQIGLSSDMKDMLLRLCPYVRRRLTLLRISKNMEII